MYSIVSISGKQFSVKEGDVLEVYKIQQKKGEKIEINDVIALEKDGRLIIKKDELKNCKVIAEIINEKKGEKIYSFKKKPKTGYKRGIGYRDSISVLKISQILPG
ncbi:MAG: 50S ribosomal protein L21 [Candidatus Omnitrophica bacterium]|nr:50S ribosomal protein L21 [Candidatus Omnitrophota bacterium]